MRLTRLLPLDDVYRTSENRKVARLTAWTVSLATLSVILLSIAGVYALTSFTVTQRRREIGIRIALGAGARRLLGGMFSRVLWQFGLGVTLGARAAVLLFQLLPRRDIEWHVPSIYTVLPVVAGLMVAAGLLATVGPARRGLRIQPIEALREGE